MSTDIVPVDTLRELYPALGNPDIIEAIAANLDDDEISVFDLDRVKLPSGGGVNWEVPGLDGMDAVKNIKGVVIGIISRRSFWEVSLDEQTEASPPDCSSDDAKFGRGLYGIGSTLHPAGDCASCPMNEFQEVKGRMTKPCKEQRLVLLLRENTALPVVVQLSPTSMKELKTYMIRLAGQGVPFYRAITELALRRVDGNPSYSVVVPSLKGRIDKEPAAELKALGDQVVEAYNASTAHSTPPEPEPKTKPKTAAASAS